MVLDNVKNCIEEFSLEEIAIFIAALQNQNSKHLLSQFDSKTIQTIENIVLTITAPKGAYFASEGRASGAFPPVNSIKDYVKSHNLQFRDSKGKYITDNSTAFLISRSIAKLGTKKSASHFLNKWKLTPEFKDKVMQAFIEDTKIELKKIIDQIEAV